MDHPGDVSIVPVKDKADSIQEDSEGMNPMTLFTSRSELTQITATSIGSSQHASADHPDQGGSSSTKPLDPAVADVNIRISDSQDSQNQMPQPAIESTAASSSREAVNNGHDHQSGASGSAKKAEGMFESNYFNI